MSSVPMVFSLLNVLTLLFFYYIVFRVTVDHVEWIKFNILSSSIEVY